MSFLADAAATGLWVSFFAVLYSRRMYFVGFVFLCALLGGLPVVKIAPVLWLVIEFPLLAVDAVKMRLGSRWFGGERK